MNRELSSVQDHLGFDENLQIGPENFRVAARVQSPSLIAADSTVMAE
jgi:hypothetical protein